MPSVKRLFPLLIGLLMNVSAGAQDNINHALLDSPNIIHTLGYGHVMHLRQHQFVGSVTYHHRPIIKPPNYFIPWFGIRFTEQSTVWQQNHWRLIQKFRLNFSRHDFTLRDPLTLVTRYHLMPELQGVGGYYRSKWMTGLNIGIQTPGLHYNTTPTPGLEKGFFTPTYFQFTYGLMGGYTFWQRLSIIISLGVEHTITDYRAPDYQFQYNLSINYHF